VIYEPLSNLEEDVLSNCLFMVHGDNFHVDILSLVRAFPQVLDLLSERLIQVFLDRCDVQPGKTHMGLMFWFFHINVVIGVLLGPLFLFFAPNFLPIVHFSRAVQDIHTIRGALLGGPHGFVVGIIYWAATTQGRPLIIICGTCFFIPLLWKGNLLHNIFESEKFGFCLVTLIRRFIDQSVIDAPAEVGFPPELQISISEFALSDGELRL
jgi:hypothetical protein